MWPPRRGPGLWRMAAKASDRRQHCTANSSRASPLTAGKCTTNPVAPRHGSPAVTTAGRRVPVTSLPYSAPGVPGRRNRSPWSSQILTYITLCHTATAREASEFPTTTRALPRWKPRRRRTGPHRVRLPIWPADADKATILRGPHWFLLRQSALDARPGDRLPRAPGRPATLGLSTAALPP